MSDRVTALRARLPVGAGLGLRPQLWHGVVEHADAIDFVELVVDDHLDLPLRDAVEALRPITEALPVVAHGVRLSVGSAQGVDEGYVERVARLLDALGVEVYSEHLSFRQAGGVELGQFMPTPFTEAWAARIARNVCRVQAITGRTLILENVTYLLGHPAAGLGEARFVRGVLEAADCAMLLDVTNLLINAANLGYDADAYLAALPAERVVLAHIAGGHDDEGFHVDSHGHAVPDAGYAMLARAAQRTGLGCALLERDKNWPPFEALLEELARVRGALEEGAAARAPLPCPRLPAVGGAPGAAPPDVDRQSAAPPDAERLSVAPPDAERLDPEALQAALARALTTPGAYRALREGGDGGALAGVADPGDAARRPEALAGYLLSFPAARVRAFEKVLRFKRREKLERLLSGLFRALGGALPRWLDDYARARPEQHLSRIDDAVGFADFVAAHPGATRLQADLARHEGAGAALRARPWRAWRLWSQRREVVLHHEPRALHAFIHGGPAPPRLPRPVRVRYQLRRAGVWVQPLGRSGL